jgi:hypothetical protein
MKLITRSTIAALFLIGFAMPVLAQNPDVAIRIKPVGNCFSVNLKNLRTNVVAVNTADLMVFDQVTCKRVCHARVPISKRLTPCQTLDFRICCDSHLPARYICHVQVFHSSGSNEGWFFNP